MGVSESGAAVSSGDYCREIERYLCRRNDGHLIRIVGPAFEKVVGWAAQGVPLKVAFHGIDRRVERQHAKGRSRRPVRIEFCEADVLDAFDEWRRAVGAVSAAGAPASDAGAQAVPDRPRRVALQAHIDRVMARLTQRRLDADTYGVLGEAIDAILHELDALRAAAHGARGEARLDVRQQLAALDARLIDAVRAAVPSREAARCDAEARRELEPFKARMAADAFARAVDAAAVRLLREAVRVPEVAAGV